MQAFFLSIALLFALLVLATAVCVALRPRVMPRMASPSVMGEEFMQPRRHAFAGIAAVGLVVLFSVTLLFAVVTR